MANFLQKSALSLLRFSSVHFRLDEVGNTSYFHLVIASISIFATKDISSMDTLEYYKLKDELSGLVKAEIATSINNERDLQHKYIGTGLKIAAAGLGAAVLALGIFGIKSMLDINSAIKNIPNLINDRADKEIVSRFSKDNPVLKYEAMLLDSSARAISASITTQLDQKQNIVLENRISDLIVRALNDKEISSATKLSLIDAIATPKIRAISPTVDQAVIATAQQFAKESPVNERSLLRCLQYFSTRNSTQFVVEVEKIYDAHGTLPKVGLTTARYAMKLNEGYGSDLIRKLGATSDSSIKLLLHIRNLKNGKITQLDRDLVRTALAAGFAESDDDKVNLGEVIDQIDSMISPFEEYSPIASQFLDAIREHALDKKLAFAIDNEDPDDMSFGFFSREGDVVSTLDRAQFDTLLGAAVGQMKEQLRLTDGTFEETTRANLDFWLPKAAADWTTNTRQLAGLTVQNLDTVRFVPEQGQEIQGNTLGARATISTRKIGDQISVVLKWSTEPGKMGSTSIRTIKDYKPRNLKIHKNYERSLD